jgi:ribonuclease R
MKDKKTAGVDQQKLKTLILSVFQKYPYKNFNHKQILRHITVLEEDGFDLEISDPKEWRHRIIQTLNELLVSGEIIELERYKYKLLPVKSYVEGRIDVTASGSAYVMNDSYEDDIFIAPRNVRNAMNGDLVKVSLLAKREGKRMEGEVVEILERAKNEFAGVVQLSPRFAFLVPDSNKMNIDIFIPPQHLKGVKNGQKAVARITEWEAGAKNPTGEIIKVLGFPGENDAEMDAILIEYGFPLSFPAEVEKEAAAIPEKISKGEIAKRRDFRKTTTFTIDPSDAKDFDDALSFKKLPGGNYEIGVHIADVSHYILPDTALDAEGYSRATSIYLVDRVIPMLPEKLSNDVCSLRPQEEKLCFSAVFEMNENAQVLNEWFGRTVIYSDKRFSYEEAQEIIEKKNGPLKEEILTMDTLAKKLRAERFRKGAINFEKVEVKFNLDDKGNPLGVYLKESKDSNKLIEEFMLLANKKVAEFIGRHHGVYPVTETEKSARSVEHGKNKLTFVYRVHDVPNPEKLSIFAKFAGQFGYRIKTSSDKEIAASLNGLIKAVNGKKEQNVLEQLAIRTMSKAIYTTENIGHYGLAFDYYTHFTSPIRRYPDVMVHRLLDHYLKGGKSALASVYEKQCKHSTDMEMKAAEAERSSIKYKQVQFLSGKNGEIFDGIISGVTEWGMYVELIENKCEGMVRLRDMSDDFYSLDENNYCIIGHRSHRKFQLGDPVRVLLKGTDLARKQINFELYSAETNPDRAKKIIIKGNQQQGRKHGGKNQQRKKW